MPNLGFVFSGTCSTDPSAPTNLAITDKDTCEAAALRLAQTLTERYGIGFSDHYPYKFEEQTSSWARPNCWMSFSSNNAGRFFVGAYFNHVTTSTQRWTCGDNDPCICTHTPPPPPPLPPVSPLPDLGVVTSGVCGDGSGGSTPTRIEDAAACREAGRRLFPDKEFFQNGSPAPPFAAGCQVIFSTGITSPPPGYGEWQETFSGSTCTQSGSLIHCQPARLRPGGLVFFNPVNTSVAYKDCEAEGSELRPCICTSAP